MDRIPPNQPNPAKAPGKSPKPTGLLGQVKRAIQSVGAAASEAARAMAYDMQPYHPNASPKVLLDRMMVSPGLVDSLSPEDISETVSSIVNTIENSKDPEDIIAGVDVLLKLKNTEEACQALASPKILEIFSNKVLNNSAVSSEVKKAAFNQLIEVSKLPDAPLKEAIKILGDIVRYGSATPEIKGLVVERLIEISQLPNAPLDQAIKILESIAKSHSATPKMKALAFNQLIEISKLPNAPLDQAIKTLDDIAKYHSATPEMKEWALKGLIGISQLPNAPLVEVMINLSGIIMNIYSAPEMQGLALMGLIEISKLPGAPLVKAMNFLGSIVIDDSVTRKMKALAFERLIEISKLHNMPFEQMIKVLCFIVNHNRATPEMKGLAFERLIEISELHNVPFETIIHAIISSLPKIQNPELREYILEFICSTLETSNFVDQNRQQALDFAQRLFDRLDEDDPFYDRVMGLLFTLQAINAGDLNNPISIHKVLMEKAKAIDEMPLEPHLSTWKCPGLPGHAKLKSKFNSQYFEIQPSIPDQLPNANLEDLEALVDHIEAWAQNASDEEWALIGYPSKEDVLGKIRNAIKPESTIAKNLSSNTYHPTVYRIKAIVEYYKEKIEKGEKLEGALCSGLMNCLTCPSGVKAGIDAEFFTTLNLKDPVDLTQLQDVMPRGPFKLALSSDSDERFELQKILLSKMGKEGELKAALKKAKETNPKATEKAVIDSIVPQEVVSKIVTAATIFGTDCLSFTLQRRLNALDGDGKLVLDFIKNKSSQPSHQRDYFLGAIGSAIGLRPKGKMPPYDRHGQCVEKPLLEATPEEMLAAFFKHYTVEGELKALTHHIIEKLKDKDFRESFVEVLSLSLFNPNKQAKEQFGVKNCFIIREDTLIPITQEAIDRLIALRNDVGEDAFYDLVDSETEDSWPEIAREVQAELKAQGVRIQDFGLLNDLKEYFPADAAFVKIFWDFGMIQLMEDQ